MTAAAHAVPVGENCAVPLMPAVSRLPPGAPVVSMRMTVEPASCTAGVGAADGVIDGVLVEEPPAVPERVAVRVGDGDRVAVTERVCVPLCVRDGVGAGDDEGDVPADGVPVGDADGRTAVYVSTATLPGWPFAFAAAHPGWPLVGAAPAAPRVPR